MIHDHFMRLTREKGPQRFVLIGANDGVTDDAVFPFVQKHGWTGVAVEPVRSYFDQLCANYQGLPVKCLNVAIHESEREVSFYFLEDKDDLPLPPYAKGIGSFDRDQVLWVAGEIPEGKSYLKEIKVACKSLGEVLAASGVDRLDVLVIDTEGYDAEVVRQIDFADWRPQTIVFEHKLLTAQAFADAVAWLEVNGFQWTKDRTDVLAWRQDNLD